MIKHCLAALGVALLTATVAVGQDAAPAPAAAPPARQGPGVQAAQDAREPAVLAQCKHAPPAAPAAGPRPAANGAAPAGPADYLVPAIPGVVEAGQRWKSIWSETGNNADGIIATRDGGLLVAQNDNSDVVKLDPDGHASVLYRDTHTGGALSMNTHGVLFIDEREFNPAIWELAPKRRLFANRFEDDPLDCLGSVLNDLSAASNGGVYFTMGGLFYADPHGKVTQYGENLRTNGIILSADEKTLYVTNFGTLVAFDVQPDGSLKNQRVLATLPGGGGDGSTIDSEGRIYVTARNGIVVLAADGTVLGTIPTPFGTISVAFSGADKKTLYAVVVERSTKPGVAGIAGGQIVALPMLAHGYRGRAK
jgi:sugar lactone lactonase YvrE